MTITKEIYSGEPTWVTVNFQKHYISVKEEKHALTSHYVELVGEGGNKVIEVAPEPFYLHGVRRVVLKYGDGRVGRYEVHF